MPDQQPVADGGAETKQTPTASGAPDAELDSLLNEFTTGTKSSEPKTEAPKAEAPKPDETLQRVAAYVQRQEAQDFEREFSQAVKAVKGETKVDDEVVGDWVQGEARRDVRLAEAWRNRASNPEAWKRVQTALAQKWAKKHAAQPDQAATDDREAVTAAVRSASTRTAEPEKPVDLGSMNNAEFEAYKRKMFRKAG